MTRSNLWRIAVLVVCLVAGLLVATTREVSHGNEIRAGDSTRLSDLVRNAQAETDDVAETRDRLAAEVESLQQEAAASDTGVAQVLADTKALATDAGLTPMTGPGVTVTLTDAPATRTGSIRWTQHRTISSCTSRMSRVC